MRETTYLLLFLIVLDYLLIWLSVYQADPDASVSIALLIENYSKGKKSKFLFFEDTNLAKMTLSAPRVLASGVANMYAAVPP